MHESEELRSLLHSNIQQHGWCQHVPSLLHSDTLSPTEKALQVSTNTTLTRAITHTPSLPPSLSCEIDDVSLSLSAGNECSTASL